MSKWLAGLAVLVVAALAAGLWAFEPWRAFTSSTVDEALPSVGTDVATAAPRASSSPEATRTPTSTSTAEPQPEADPEPVELARGRFVDAEHGTSGLARVIELVDGSRFVRLEGLSTSDGPDLHVGLSDAPSGGSWGSYDDGRYHQLGALKATDGNQNYQIPPDVDLRGLASVVIWCDRFNVAFGTAPLAL